MTLGRSSSIFAVGGLRATFALLALVCTVLGVFAVNFPALTGRIVDQANVIPAATRAAIEPKVVGLEAKSGIQLVVATVASLEGQEIEPYANQLFRTWKLGEKAKNNGVLLLVAPHEHRVRIEVGYGLEGTLTDALSKIIITNAILPRFKAGDYGGGISRGVDDIITVLTTDSSEWQKHPTLRRAIQQPATDPTNWVLLGIAIAVVALMIISPGFRWFALNIILNILLSSGSSRGGGGFSSGGSSGGDDFSGGGGSSGGGGASGSW